MSVNEAKIQNLRNRLFDVANALDDIVCEDCERAESAYMTMSEAQKIFAHAAEFGTRGLTKSQIITAWQALRS